MAPAPPRVLRRRFTVSRSDALRFALRLRNREATAGGPGRTAPARSAEASGLVETRAGLPDYRPQHPPCVFTPAVP